MYTEIKPKSTLWSIDFKEIWRYRDLLFLLVRRDFVSVYKQTILGPIWFFIQPLFTTGIFTIVFSLIAKIETNEIPAPLFYVIGITFWTYFSTCLTATSNTFKENASVFGKVYFPRLIAPLSITISSLLKLGIQFLLIVVAFFYYYFTTDILKPNITLLLIPFYVLLLAGMGLGFGIVLSSLTTKYRDFSFLVAFGVQLLMYATPIIYPLSLIETQPKLKPFIMANPLTGIMEALRYAFTGSGELNLFLIGYSVVFVSILLFLGVLIFNKVEKSFIDTV